MLYIIVIIFMRVMYEPSKAVKQARTELKQQILKKLLRRRILMSLKQRILLSLLIYGFT